VEENRSGRSRPVVDLLTLEALRSLDFVLRAPVETVGDEEVSGESGLYLKAHAALGRTRDVLSGAAK
jgi:hypothetical protein